jgi:signal transduction histidine kinase
VCHVVSDVVEALERAAAAARVRVVVDAAQCPAVPVEADRLDQAVLNLVSNAIKYSDPGSEVSVGIERLEDEVAISIRDRGMGISNSDQASLFTEFFRSSNPDALNRPGTGLGLTIAHRIARGAGGRIEVTSTLGEGSEFRLVLPVFNPDRHTDWHIEPPFTDRQAEVTT